MGMKGALVLVVQRASICSLGVLAFIVLGCDTSAITAADEAAGPATSMMQSIDIARTSTLDPEWQTALDRDISLFQTLAQRSVVVSVSTTWKANATIEDVIGELRTARKELVTHADIATVDESRYVDGGSTIFSDGGPPNPRNVYYSAFTVCRGSCESGSLQTGGECTLCKPRSMVSPRLT